MGDSTLDGGLKDALRAATQGESAGGVKEFVEAVQQGGTLGEEAQEKVSEFVSAVAELATMNGHEVMVGELGPWLANQIFSGASDQWQKLASDLVNRAVARDSSSGTFESIDMGKIDKSGLLADIKSSNFDMDTIDLDDSPTAGSTQPAEDAAVAEQAPTETEQKAWWKFW